MGERIDALHIFTNNSGNYNKLHDGEPIGESIISDLRQYFLLLFKNDYRYDYYNWQKIEKGKKPPDECYYDIGIDNDFSKIRNKVIKYIKENKFNDNIEIPERVLITISNVNFIRDESYIKGKYPYITIDDNGEKHYYIPDIITNDNYREKAIIASDLNKLNNMFKSFNYKNIDEFVLLDFYKEFKNKIDVIKNKIISDDDDIKKSIRDDIIEKLKIIYKIDKKKSNKRNDRTDIEIEKIINERATRLANLNLIKDYNQTTGGGKTLSIDFLDTNLPNIFKEIQNIKKKNIQLNEIDRDILYGIKDIINLDEEIDETFTINKINGKREGTLNIKSECGADIKKITKIIKDNSIKKYEKYLALIYTFNSSKNNSQSGGVIMSGNQQPLLEAQKIQVPKFAQYSSNDPTNQNENAAYNNNKDLVLIDTILPELKEIYVNLINIYTSVNRGREEYGRALINEILKGPEDDINIVNFDDELKKAEAIRNNIKEENKKEKDKDETEFRDRINKVDGRDGVAYQSNNRLIEETNSKIANLDKLKKFLDQKREELLKELKRLYATLIKLKKIPYVTEYYEYIISIINKFKLNFVDTSNVDNCTILREFNDYITGVGSLFQQAVENKEITNKISQSYGKQNDMKKSDENAIRFKHQIQQKLTEGADLTKLKELIHINDDNELYNIIDLLRNTSVGENTNEPGVINTKKNNNIDDEELIYEKLWKEYNNGISNNSKVANPAERYFTYIEEGEKLKKSIILNDLDPEIVLKVNIQDKAVFILLIFIIRTISIAIIELLIEYNMIKSLQYCVMIYAILYISILLIFIIFINLDAYKLRIIFNYLNTHANTSNVIIHFVLFSIFAFLVVIIIQTDDFINNAGDILDYTYIYDYILNINYDKIFKGEFKGEFENNISPDEKIKLLYRIDIISMLIFIFTATLTLLI